MYLMPHEAGAPTCSCCLLAPADVRCQPLIHLHAPCPSGTHEPSTLPRASAACGPPLQMDARALSSAPYIAPKTAAEAAMVLCWEQVRAGGQAGGRGDMRPGLCADKLRSAVGTAFPWRTSAPALALSSTVLCAPTLARPNHRSPRVPAGHGPVWHRHGGWLPGARRNLHPGCPAGLAGAGADG